MTQTLHRRAFLTLAAGGAMGLVAASVLPAVAKSPRHYTGLVSGVAVGGYDPVAYFTQGKPVRGSKSHSLRHEGVEWRFASAENLAAFKANPAKYKPRYGGYCAYAVANGYTAKGDPRAWSIEGGRLYLNYNKSIRRRWSAKKATYIRAGDSNWPGVLN